MHLGEACGLVEALEPALRVVGVVLLRGSYAWAVLCHSGAVSACEVFRRLFVVRSVSLHRETDRKPGRISHARHRLLLNTDHLRQLIPAGPQLVDMRPSITIHIVPIIKLLVNFDTVATGRLKSSLGLPVDPDTLEAGC